MFGIFPPSPTTLKGLEIIQEENFDVLLTVHISIILAIDQLNAQILMFC
jgi:hypothetical protein